MILLDLPAAALAWLGRQGTRAIAASIFIGLAVPPLAAFFKPLVPYAIFLLLVLAFLRVEPAALRAAFARPGILLAATAWIMIVTPALLGLVFLLFDVREAVPTIFVALILQAAAPPIMSAPAFVALLGWDAALALATLVTTIIVTPLFAPLFAHAFVGPDLTLSALELSIRLFLFLAGSALLAALVRKLGGAAWVERQRERIDGLSVIALFSFAVAVMDGVAMRLFNQPLFVLGLILLAFVITLGLMVVTALVFWRAGRDRALALALSAGFRNMGLMLAAAGGSLADLTWLYFGLAQFPIYLLPQFLGPLARRLESSRESE